MGDSSHVSENMWLPLGGSTAGVLPTFVQLSAALSEGHEKLLEKQHFRPFLGSTAF